MMFEENEQRLPCLDALIIEALGLEEGEEPDHCVVKRILEALVAEAIAGNVRAADILLGRAYGKAPRLEESIIPAEAAAKWN